MKLDWNFLGGGGGWGVSGVRHMQTADLQTADLQTCRLADCRLAACRLADCRLAECRLADLQTADCDLGFGIKNCRLNYSSFNNTRPSMVIFPTAKCVFGGRQSSVIELVTPSQYCLKLLD